MLELCVIELFSREHKKNVLNKAAIIKPQIDPVLETVFHRLKPWFIRVKPRFIIFRFTAVSKVAVYVNQTAVF
jgi:hypothetical protein